jgi:8-oxo-dGTP diphosphatase/2-hydroxy-dATP diphosphatase
MKKQLTLCIVTKDNKVLLGMKKRGFGAGHWNGFGGKLMDEESIIDAAMREIKEESGIVPTEINKVGILDFEFENDPKILEVHIFLATKFDGEPVETEEMRPKWFEKTQIPYDQMWSDDILWLPLLLAGKKFMGKFLFDHPSSSESASKILSHELKEVPQIND